MSEIKPFCYLVQTSSDRNPPHGWAVHFTDGDVPLYTAADIATAREEGRRDGLSPLSRAQCIQIMDSVPGGTGGFHDWYVAVVRAVEVAHGIKEKRDETAGAGRVARRMPVG